MLLGDTLRTTGAAAEATDATDAARDEAADADSDGNEPCDIEGEESLDDELAGITTATGAATECTLLRDDDDLLANNPRRFPL